MTRFALAAAVAIGLIATVSCGGSGGSKPSAVPPAGNGAPGSTTSAPQTTTFALQSGVAMTHALPSAGGFGGSISLPPTSAAGGTTMTIAMSTSAPPNAAFPAANVRRPQSGGVSVLTYLTFTASASVTFPGFPAIAVTIPPSANVAGQYFLALSDPTATNAAAQFRTEGPAAVAGTNLSFAASSEPLTFQAGKQYVVALYASEEITRTPGAFYALYTGDKRSALDPIQATGEYTAATNTFTFSALMAGPIFSGQDNYYVWGIDRGGSTNAPFPQEPNVKFNAVIVVSAEAERIVSASVTLIPGTAPTALDPSAVHIDGAKITVSVPASLFPSTGSGPAGYQWDLWTRSELGGPIGQLAKFIPENALAPFLPGAQAAAPPPSGPATPIPSGAPTTAPSTAPTAAPTAAPTLAPAMQIVHIGFELEDITDPTFGQVAYYALTQGTAAQVIRVAVGSQVVFVNDDPSGSAHTASGLGASGFPATFANTSATTRSGTAIDSGLTWSTGTLSAGQQSQTFTIPTAGTYYFGCAFHYASNKMRDVLVAS